VPGLNGRHAVHSGVVGLGLVLFICIRIDDGHLHAGDEAPRPVNNGSRDLKRLRFALAKHGQAQAEMRARSQQRAHTFAEVFGIRRAHAAGSTRRVSFTDPPSVDYRGPLSVLPTPPQDFHFRFISRSVVRKCKETKPVVAARRVISDCARSRIGTARLSPLAEREVLRNLQFTDYG